MFRLSRCSLLAIVFTSSVAVFAATAEDPATYTFTTFDVQDADATHVMAINAHGDVAGYYTQDGIDHGFVMRKGILQVLDAPEPATFATWVLGISASGVLTGMYRYPGNCTECPPWLNFQMRGFKYDDGVLEVIDVPDAAYTIGTAINANGDIVGEYWTAGKAYGFLNEAGAITPLDISQLPDAATSWSAAYGINARGDVVGWYGNSLTWEFHGYLLRRGQLTTLDLPGLTWTVAAAINDRGDVVLNGYQNWTVTESHVWRDGALTRIEFPDSVWTQASGINDSGDVVGSYATADGRIHGFIARRR